MKWRPETTKKNGLNLKSFRNRNNKLNSKQMKKVMPIYGVVLFAAVFFSSLTTLGETMREPDVVVKSTKDDFSISDQVSAEARSTKIIRNNYESLVIRRMGYMDDGAALLSLAGLSVTDEVVYDKTSNAAHFELMRANAGYDVIFYPQYEKRVIRPILGLGSLMTNNDPTYAAAVPGLAMAGWLGVGISCEPLDISGGGFFAEVMWNEPLLDLGRVGRISLRPVFGIGPLPLNASWILLDAFAVWEYPLTGFNLFAGVGYGLIYDFRGGRLEHSDVIATFGLSDVPLAGGLRMFVHIRTRGIGFFISPGVGLKFGF